MADLISRQAAIDVVNGIDSYFVKYIEALPSAQPEIIRCKDCKYLNIDSIYSQYWCGGRKVYPDFYCGKAERKTYE